MAKGRRWSMKISSVGSSPVRRKSVTKRAATKKRMSPTKSTRVRGRNTVAIRSILLYNKYVNSQVSPPKKKILFVITKSNWGGAQRYVYDLATSLPKEEFEVVVTFGQKGQLAEKLEKVGI